MMVKDIYNRFEASHGETAVVNLHEITHTHPSCVIIIFALISVARDTQMHLSIQLSKELTIIITASLKCSEILATTFSATWFALLKKETYG